MRSATSYFNGTLYRKTLARFWPLWGLWGLGWLFLAPLRLLNLYFNAYHSPIISAQDYLLNEARELPSMLSPGVFLALLFAVLCAMAVFGYLYNHRSACWTHALPMRREALFTTQYLVGLSMMLLPLLAAAVLTAIVEVSFLPMENWGEVLAALLTWLLAQCGLCLFFFSFAAFCAMFTGHILALPAFYGILNGLAAGLWFLVDALMNEFFYGYAGTRGALTVVEYLTPAEALTQAVRWWTEDGLSSPGVVAGYAVVGVGLALVSLYVYRRRRRGGRGGGQAPVQIRGVLLLRAGLRHVHRRLLRLERPARPHPLYPGLDGRRLFRRRDAPEKVLPGAQGLERSGGDGRRGAGAVSGLSDGRVRRGEPGARRRPGAVRPCGN